MQFESAMQLCQNSGVKVLVFGHAGSGKTRMISTAPNPVILSAESGLLSLRKVMQEQQVDYPVKTINTMADLLEAIAYFESMPLDQRVNTICLDSISEIGEVVLNHEKAKTKDPRKAYGELIDVMTSVIRRFRDLQGYNVYITAKLASIKDEQSGLITQGPSLPGAKMGPALPYFFDEVFYLYVGKDANGVDFRALQTASDHQVPCVKDRSGTLAPVEVADLNYIFTKINQ